MSFSLGDTLRKDSWADFAYEDACMWAVNSNYVICLTVNTLKGAGNTRCGFAEVQADHMSLF